MIQHSLKSRMARWQIAPDWLIGLTQWRDQPFRETPEYAAFCRDDTPFVQQGLKGHSPAASGHVKSPELLLKFLEWVQTPLEERKLIAHLVRLRAAKPRVTVSLQGLTDDANKKWIAAPKEPEAQWDWEPCWKAICNLPLMSRAVFLLALEPRELVILTALANPCACVAAVLEIDPDEMERLWEQLPLKDEEIAQLYGTTVGNIQQKRFFYRNTSKNSLKEPPLL